MEKKNISVNGGNVSTTRPLVKGTPIPTLRGTAYWYGVNSEGEPVFRDEPIVPLGTIAHMFRRHDR